MVHDRVSDALACSTDQKRSFLYQRREQGSNDKLGDSKRPITWLIFTNILNTTENTMVLKNFFATEI